MVLVTAPFAAVARSSAAARGVPDLPIVVFPPELESSSDDVVAAAFAERLPAIFDGLGRC